MHVFLKSKEVEQIQKEVEGCTDRMLDDLKRVEDQGDEEGYRIAQMAHSHLVDAMLELLNATNLIEKLEIDGHKKVCLNCKHKNGSPSCGLCARYPFLKDNWKGDGTET